MFPYTVKYTESGYDIQNNNFLYKIDQQCQNTFDCSELFRNIRKRNQTNNIFFCNMYNSHSSFFVMFVTLVILANVVIWGFVYLYYLYNPIRTPLRTPLRAPLRGRSLQWSHSNQRCDEAVCRRRRCHRR